MLYSSFRSTLPGRTRSPCSGLSLHHPSSPQTSPCRPRKSIVESDYAKENDHLLMFGEGARLAELRQAKLALNVLSYSNFVCREAQPLYGSINCMVVRDCAPGTQQGVSGLHDNIGREPPNAMFMSRK
jgi:hypothetical protein